MVEIKGRQQLYAVSVLYKNGQMRVYGWHTPDDALAAYDRITGQRSTLQAMKEGDPHTSDDRACFALAPISDDYGQRSQIDLAEVVVISLLDQRLVHDLSGVLQYFDLNGQAYRNKLVKDDTSLRIALGATTMQMPGGSA